MIIILRNYQRKYGLNTIDGITRHWPPPNENDTQAYIKSVATATGTDSDKPIDLTDSRKLFPPGSNGTIRYDCTAKQEASE
ncbi:hypothetical protein [Pantoea sp. BAV 3049]|uniref:hypothetical protein n=1 Tax=Pantoea sp. BAV 3049 TaxID=2654188 RepID=UPI00351B984C